VHEIVAMKFKLKNIKPNPFRLTDRYPIQKEKVEGLRESIRTTTFWDNIVARQRDGHAEIAYGHHRIEALRLEYGPNHEVDPIVRDLDDETMLQIMVRENKEEWGASPEVERETIRAIVAAYGDGQVKLPAPDPRAIERSTVRYAPSFRFSSGKNLNPYTAETLAEFTGWSPGKTASVLQALELIEKGGVLEESELVGLSKQETTSLVENAAATLRWREKSQRHKATAKATAREVAQAIIEDFSEKQPGRLRDRAAQVRAKIEGPKKNKPDINPFVKKLNARLFKILSPDDEMTQQIREVLECIDSLKKEKRDSLRSELQSLANRASELAKLVKSGKAITKKQTQKLLMSV
jgi:hypothetical protein